MELAHEILRKIKSMSKKHSNLPLNVWGLKTIPEGEYRKILDMGCGGGKNISYLLHKFPYSRVTGADLSDLSLSMPKRISSGAFNREYFGLNDISISKLPFEDESYDLVTAFETVYFWPGPVESFQEIHRILSSGGRFVIVNGIVLKTADRDNGIVLLME